MFTTNQIYTNFGTTSTSKYGVTEAKKADLDRLQNEVLIAQGEVDQMQAIVNALTEKSTNFQNFLNAASNNKDQALSNKNFVDQVVQNALELMNESEIAKNQMGMADLNTKDVAGQINNVINKLIYSAEVINKLANTVIKEKTLNPLISDDLINMIDKAGTDANNAVALCLTALESTFAAQASNGESEAAFDLEYKESINLYIVLTGNLPVKIQNENTPLPPPLNDSIVVLLEVAYLKALEVYESATIANNDTNEELDEATANLERAQINLQSLQAGLAAAKAAAFA